MIVEPGDFATPTTQGFAFNKADKKRLANTLRKMADGFENGQALFQEARFSSKTSIEDYQLTELTLIYAEKVS